MAGSISLLSFISLFFSIFIASSFSASPPKPTTITIPISPFPKHPSSSSDPFQSLNFFASATISRARHLKRPKSNSSLTKTPLFPRSYGGYSISLSFGTPPQTISFVMDTGSSLVWLPCTSRYLCSECSFPNIEPTKIPTFMPKFSSSSKLVGCRNPKCGWIFGDNVKCEGCEPSSKNCSQTCPAYLIQYGSGSTVGKLLSETLDFPEKTVSDFLVGCSLLSIRQPSGIAGFGRGQESLPSQLGLSKFSYCLISHKFDDTPQSSDLVLYSGSNSGDTKNDGLSYTPFQKNPGTSKSAFRDYYYLLLRKVIVGGESVEIPYKYLVPGSDGNGGTIVDSGSTFTFMEKPVFQAVSQAFTKQMANYTRARDVESRTGLQPCFDISREKSVIFPELVFKFKGGAKMALPITNYFSLVTDSGIACLTIVTDGVAGPEVDIGPAIILGNYQQQNFHIEYDLENDRFGFRKQSCQ
ncbi:hypothetical protein FNV43_RR16644 [Rhamnella rubrinervis]|uniref:Peptidase A1 domain-containing protein n=1 Tax=Rhamnella rubrinervis TaxID=2594499 RepID=A0A8K0GZ55_9ROSA|nr:hypothetical protein FNV43_RR16644 [Rhamnella rubrinervis]